jgi:hypothetical protein
MVVKKENDENAPSKNWEEGEVHTLIAICNKMEAEFLENASKQGNPIGTMLCDFFFCKKKSQKI